MDISIFVKTGNQKIVLYLEIEKGSWQWKCVLGAPLMQGGKNDIVSNACACMRVYMSYIHTCHSAALVCSWLKIKHYTKK